MIYVSKCSCGDEFEHETLSKAQEHVELENKALQAHGVDMSKHVYSFEERADASERPEGSSE